MTRAKRKKIPASVRSVERGSVENTWILIARRDKAKLLEYSGTGTRLKLLRGYINPAGALRTGALVSDRPGRIYRAAIGVARHAAARTESAHEHALNEFARALASDMKMALSRGSCDRIVIAAEPHCLGKIKKHLGTTARKPIMKTIDKDFFLLRNPELYTKLRPVLR